MNRRSVLQLFGSVPVVGPSLARKLAAEETAASLAGISVTGLTSSGVPTPQICNEIGYSQRKLALQIPWFRRELEQLIAERDHNVYQLDPDLAVLKSVSLSAKICYQRQRNIERNILSYTQPEPYYRIEALFSKIAKLLG